MGLEILYLLIPASILLAVIALVLFIWAIHSGQFDDLETPAIRILFDDAETTGENAQVPPSPPDASDPPPSMRRDPAKHPIPHGMPDVSRNPNQKDD